MMSTSYNHGLGWLWTEGTSSDTYNNMSNVPLDPLSLDPVNDRLGINITTPTSTLDVNGDAYIRGNLTSTSAIKAGTMFKLGGLVTDDTSLINTGSASLNILGKRYVPAPGQPFDPNADTLRTVQVVDRLNVEGLIRTASKLKVGGVYTDNNMFISEDSSNLVIAGKATNTGTRLVRVQDKLVVDEAIMTGFTIKFGGEFTDADLEIFKGTNSLTVVGRGVYPNREVKVLDKLTIEGAPTWTSNISWR